MELFVNFPKFFACYVSINLCCGNAFMTKKFLDGPQIDSLIQKIGGE